jgi:hypothetical protein
MTTFRHLDDYRDADAVRKNPREAVLVSPAFPSRDQAALAPRERP